MSFRDERYQSQLLEGYNLIWHKGTKVEMPSCQKSTMGVGTVPFGTTASQGGPD